MSFVAVGVSAMAVGTGIKVAHNMNQASKARKAQNKASEELDNLEANSPVYAKSDKYQRNIDLATGVLKGYEPYTKTSQLAGQALMENRIANNSANAVANLERTGGAQGQVTAGIGAALNAQNEAETELGIKGAQQRKDYQQLSAGATQQLEGVNKDFAEQDQLEWQNNVLDKFKRKYQRQGTQFTYQQQRSQQARDAAADSVGSGLTSIGGMIAGMPAPSGGLKSYAPDAPPVGSTMNSDGTTYTADWQAGLRKAGK